MAGLLPSAEQCCDPCTSPVSVAVPGPAGSDGDDGAAGAAGVSAYTTTTAQFTMPAEGANVTISVGVSAPFGIGQVVYIEAGGAKGYFEVITKPGATSLQVQNIESTGSSLYAVNSAPGTVFAIGATVSPAGIQGPAGSSSVGAPDSATYITQTPHAGLSAEQALNALTAGAIMKTNAGGSGALEAATAGTDYYAPGSTDVAVADGGTGASNAAGARTNLGLVIGTDVQAYNANLANVATNATAFFLTLVNDADAATARATLGVLAGYGILGSATAVDHNATGDTSITIGSGRYIIDKVMVDNASISLTTARSGLFTAAGGGGTTIAADQVLSALTASSKFLNLTKEAVAGTDVFTGATLYYRVGTAQGAAATANVRIFGWKLD